MNIKDLLKYGIKELKANNVEESDLKCKILLAKLLNVRKEYFVIHENETVEKSIELSFIDMLEKLKSGIPLQYITNLQEFMGLQFYVDENVLIPQPDTEVLVLEAIEILKNNDLNIKVLDLCTGSGAIAIALKKNCEFLEVEASDISERALEIARKNAKNNNVKVKFVLSNMFENIHDKYDFIISNPPYVEEDLIPNLSIEVQNEPYIALAGGKDGLKFYNIIARQAKKFLNANGYIAVEIGYNQKEKVMSIFEMEGYGKVYSKKDFGGNDRIIVAKL